MVIAAGGGGFSLEILRFTLDRMLNAPLLDEFDTLREAETVISCFGGGGVEAVGAIVGEIEVVGPAMVERREIGRLASGFGTFFHPQALHNT